MSSSGLSFSLVLSRSLSFSLVLFLVLSRSLTFSLVLSDGAGGVDPRFINTPRPPLCIRAARRAAQAPSRIARDILPVLTPLLDEKALNAKQFEMVATRVDAMLKRVVEARR